ncbi:MAG: ATP-binding protein [Chthoniobacterales bacterium]|nr:ATP-binding protein [Chthoniobacterales bacterium]
MIRQYLLDFLIDRLEEPRRFIQVLAGPRQVGKTTLIQQLLEKLDIPFHYASADAPALQGQEWLRQQWEEAHLKAGKKKGVLVLDEIQKIHQWSELVKKLWDQDTHTKSSLHVILLGSSPLLIQSGLTESLAGRFELIPISHWSFSEIKKAFDWDLKQFIYYGAYPGAASLIKNPERWRHYILESLVETSISRDILLMTRVDKPGLLRRLFQLSCDYSGQILSYQKMLGQLTDAGNTVTLAHYLQLLQSAGMVGGLAKYTHGKIHQRASSPKLQVFNTALLSASTELTIEEAISNREHWGRLVESAVGAHLLNQTFGTTIEVQYWREGNHEVDFVLKKGKTIVGIEVKSGRSHSTTRALEIFRTRFKPLRNLLVGEGGIPIEQFLLTPVRKWLEK